MLPVCPIFVARARLVSVRVPNALLRSRLGARAAQDVGILYTHVVFHSSGPKALIPSGIMAILDIPPLDSSTHDSGDKIDAYLFA
jgi:hypothetical protein